MNEQQIEIVTPRLNRITNTLNGWFNWSARYFILKFYNPIQRDMNEWDEYLLALNINSENVRNFIAASIALYSAYNSIFDEKKCHCKCA